MSGSHTSRLLGQSSLHTSARTPVALLQSSSSRSTAAAAPSPSVRNPLLCSRLLAQDETRDKRRLYAAQTLVGLGTRCNSHSRLGAGDGRHAAEAECCATPGAIDLRRVQVRDDATDEFLSIEDDEDEDEEVDGALDGRENAARSLASIFESDDELIEVDAEQTDEGLLVRHTAARQTGKCRKSTQGLC